MPSRPAPRLSLDLLRGFRAAARNLSFTRAAQEMFVTQSAISHMVKALEQQLGVPLFRRANRALQLTHAGDELLRAVEDALSIVDAAATRISGSSSVFAVTTSVPFASTWLGPRLARFARLHPDHSLRMVASNDMLDLERDHIDVALRYFRKAATPSGEKLVDYESFPVCSPALARSRTRPLRSLSDLRRHILLDMETAANGRPWYDWKQWMESIGLRSLESSGSLRFSHYDQLIEAALQGSGVAIGKLPHLARHLHEGTLVAPLGAAAMTTPGAYYIVVAPGASAGLVDAFKAWLHAEVARDRRLLTPGTAAPARPRRP